MKRKTAILMMLVAGSALAVTSVLAQNCSTHDNENGASLQSAAVQYHHFSQEAEAFFARHRNPGHMIGL